MSNAFLPNCQERPFLKRIQDNLRHCSAFAFSVSFIKKAGLVLLLPDLDAALKRGCQGRIITSTYQNFTDIESLRTFLSLMRTYPTFACHIDYECFHDTGYNTRGYHSKGYLFAYPDGCEAIVGSSNITRYALLKNIEWDVSLTDPSVYQHALIEFNELWLQTKLLDEGIIDLYANKLNFAIVRWDMDYDLSRSEVKPNFMQRNALNELNRYRAMGTGRALVIAAAGSGKTYLAAFDALNFNPKRLLYIVHEGSILRKSYETFQKVFGTSVTYGIYSGNSKELDADFVFASNVMMSRSLALFRPQDFDYIIIDECHHAVASTYAKIINYFQPEFLLGLTATPERMDNEDVLSLFDENVPYELRLRDAIINKLIVPFKYYGIRDQIVDYGLRVDEERKMIAQLASEEHAEFIVKQIEKYRPNGKLKALAFCRNVTHARMMCEAMGEYYYTSYLTGRNTIGERLRAYNDLQSETPDTIEILFTVDILNEGVDIPGINMVLFLRPTDSSTIFIQQLGRGLRIYKDKPYVTVLDFIGNSYKRSVQIAFALGSLAQNLVLEKRLLQAMVKDDFRAIGLQDQGVEIYFDDLSKVEVIGFLENENFNRLSYLRQDYLNFKQYINTDTYPRHLDYLNNDYAPDLLRFMGIKIAGKKTCSYFNFLKGINEEGLPSFAEDQIALINYLSSLLPLVRRHEYLIVECLLKGICDREVIKQVLKDSIKNCRDEESEHALKFMLVSGCFVSLDEQLSFLASLDSSLRAYLLDLLEYGLTRYSVEYGDSNDFKLYQSYRIEQVQTKFLRNPKYNQVGTYYYDDNVIIFASIKKDSSIEEHLKYNDKFLSSTLFQWESMANVTDNDVRRLRNCKQVSLFIRKVALENGLTLPFTYVGTGTMTNPRRLEKLNDQSGKKTITYLFDIPLDHALPDYLQYDFGLLEQRY